MTVTNQVELKSNIIAWVKKQKPTEHFTVRDIMEELNCSNWVQTVLNELVDSGKLFVVKYPMGVGKAYIYSTGKQKPREVIPIPIGSQSELWNTMGSICGPVSEAPILTYAELFEGINRWCDIVWQIWEARNCMSNSRSMGDSVLSGFNTIMYSSQRGGVRGNAA